MALRIYLTGSVALEHGERLVTEAAFPGRQGRLAFVFLVEHRARSVSRSELTDVIWPDGPPKEADSALSAILSKLRALLKTAGASPADATIDVRSSTLAIRFGPETWIDIEAATNAIDEAEGALRADRLADAWGCANVVVSIARRPFLADHEAPWIAARRTELRTLLRRGLDCLAAASELARDPALAVQYATEALALEPFRETTYQQLMRLHAGMGNRAEALRVFAQCRELLREELGASPSPQTEAVFLEILRASVTRRPNVVRPFRRRALGTRTKKEIVYLQESIASVSRESPCGEGLLVCRKDALPAREVRGGAGRPRGHRGIPPDQPPLEPLEGPEEAHRLAPVPGLLLRPRGPGRSVNRP